MDDARLHLVDILAQEVLRAPTGAWMGEDLWHDLLHKPCDGDETLISEAIAYAQVQKSGLQEAQEPQGEIAPTTRVGRNTVVRYLGEGGMGVVYEVVFHAERYTKSGALKLIKDVPSGVSTEAFLRRFREEEKILAGLAHPNIIEILDDGTFEERPYFVTKLVRGALGIDEHCAARRLPLRDRLRLFQSICGAVHYAHSQGVFHRDLKPSNILVSIDSELKIVDFGLAKSLWKLGDTETRASDRSLIGATQRYTAPEVAEGEEATVANDVFSLGWVLEEIASSCPEYVGTSEAQIAGRKDIDSAISQAKRRRPEQRQKSVKELALQLTSLADPSAVVETKMPESSPPLPQILNRQVPWKTLIAGFVILLFSSFGAWRYYNGSIERDKQSSGPRAKDAADKGVRPQETHSSGPQLSDLADGKSPSELVRPVDRAQSGKAITSPGKGSNIGASDSPKEDLSSISRPSGFRPFGTSGDLSRVLSGIQPSGDIKTQQCQDAIKGMLFLHFGKEAKNSRLGDDIELSLMKAADVGDLRARRTLAMLYLSSRNSLLNKVPDAPNQGFPCLDSMFPLEKSLQAVSWLRSDARTSNWSATFLSMVLREAIGGIEKNDTEAYLWAKKASEGDYPAGHYHLGVHYWLALGVRKDGTTARDLWNKGAGMDDLYCQSELAHGYAYGDRGVPKDRFLAYFWADLASSNTQIFLDHGDIDYSGFAADVKAQAKDVRFQTLKFLKPDEIADYDKQLAEWKTQHRSAR